MKWRVSRRKFMAGVGAAAAASRFAMPALAQSANAKVLKFTPAAGLTVLDPSTVFAAPSNSHTYHVFDTLYGVDGQYRAKPQMAEGHNVSSDKLTWDITLRPGLKFHDGERVLARDCVASIKRWWQKDLFGQTLQSYTDEVSAVDDKTIRFRLKKPFGVLPDALGKSVSAPCAMMPERIANPDASKLVTEMVGSGPLKFVANEFVPGQRAVYVKNTDYVPRQEPPENTSGGKVMNFDRVEWHTIADFATAAAALQSGEIDWWENVHFDLLELLSTNKNIKIETQDPYFTLLLRFNCGVAPFNNPELRKVVAAAISQKEVMSALVGANPDMSRECYAMYNCGINGVEEQGKALMSGPKDYAALAQKVKAAGYKGEKIVMFHIVDAAATAPLSPVIADVLRKIGISVDLQSVDLATWFSRRASQAPLSEGGWSLFVTWSGFANTYSPGVNLFIRGLGTKGYAGNFEDAQIESLVSTWLSQDSEADRMATLNKIQERAWEVMPVVPLGLANIKTGFRSNITGYVRSTVAAPWNLRRA